ncbi:MAG: chlorophyll a/b-binding protein [Cyanobacteria bacterium P01_E01_bin.43]
MAPDTPDTPETLPEAPEAATTDTEPTAVDDTPSFGLNDYAERINGRFAMIGFVALLLVELITHQTFFAWLGF